MSGGSFRASILVRHHPLRANAASCRLPCALLPLLALMSGVCGCTVLTSELPSQLATDGRMPAGVYYALPRGLVPVKLTVTKTTGRYFVAVMDPQFIPDPNHRYLMHYQPLPNYTDDITIEVNDRGLPQAVNSTTTDETPQIILNLAKFFGEISRQAGSPATGADDLMTLTIDPTKEEEVARPPICWTRKCAGTPRRHLRTAPWWRTPRRTKPQRPIWR